ncbi:hypothetical protein AKO1_001225, partial [Acrasis kona]
MVFQRHKRTSKIQKMLADFDKVREAKELLLQEELQNKRSQNTQKRQSSYAKKYQMQHQASMAEFSQAIIAQSTNKDVNNQVGSASPSLSVNTTPNTTTSASQTNVPEVQNVVNTKTFLQTRRFRVTSL